MEAVPEMNNKVVRTAELETTKDDQGRKILNGKYLVEKTLTSNTLCKLSVASLVEDPSKKVCLKIWKK